MRRTDRPLFSHCSFVVVVVVGSFFARLCGCLAHSHRSLLLSSLIRLWLTTHGNCRRAKILTPSETKEWVSERGDGDGDDSQLFLKVAHQLIMMRENFNRWGRLISSHRKKNLSVDVFSLNKLMLNGCLLFFLVWCPNFIFCWSWCWFFKLNERFFDCVTFFRHKKLSHQTYSIDFFDPKYGLFLFYFFDKSGWPWKQFIFDIGVTSRWISNRFHIGM